jgi:predicted TIM-barrel fold metal-dependent hydrolase
MRESIDLKIWRENIMKQSPEEIIDPALPICDPHHHLWDYPDSLPADSVPRFLRGTRHYLLQHLLEDISGGHNIVKTVFVDCSSMYRQDGAKEMSPVGETEFVQGIAAQSASGLYGNTRVAAGIVSFADLTLGAAVEPVLEAHIAASPNRFRGIRYISTWHADPEISSRVKDPGLLSNPSFRQGFALLRKHNLSFDAWLYHTQIPDLVNLAKAFPDTTIILDHIGGPLAIGPYRGRQDEVMEDWKKAIAALSQCPNAVVKLGGLGMEMMGFGWHDRPELPGSQEIAAAMAPHFDWCIEKFGVSRCMFESNFPVDKVSYSYTAVWNAFKLYARDCSPAEKADLFYNTAVGIYRLDA